MWRFLITRKIFPRAVHLFENQISRNDLPPALYVGFSLPAYVIGCLVMGFLPTFQVSQQWYQQSWTLYGKSSRVSGGSNMMSSIPFCAIPGAFSCYCRIEGIFLWDAWWCAARASSIKDACQSWEREEEGPFHFARWLPTYHASMPMSAYKHKNCGHFGHILPSSSFPLLW